MLVLSLRRKAVSQAVRLHSRDRLTYVTQSFGGRLTIIWRSPEDCLAVANRSFDKCRKTCEPRCAGERTGRLMAKGRGATKQKNTMPFSTKLSFSTLFHYFFTYFVASFNQKCYICTVESAHFMQICTVEGAFLTQICTFQGAFNRIRQWI